MFNVAKDIKEKVYTKRKGLYYDILVKKRYEKKYNTESKRKSNNVFWSI